MSSEIKFSNLPVQTPTDTADLMLVGYDLSKPVGSQDRVISAAGMLAVVAGGTLTAAGINTILGYVPISSTGTVSAAHTLASGQTLTYLGDATGTVTFNGSASANVTLTLPTVATAGTFSKVTIDAKGRVLSGSAIVSADVTGALGYTPMANTSSAVISALGYTPVSNSATVASANTLTNPQVITFGGDVSGSVSFNGSAAQNPNITLAAVGTSGTYSKVTVDAKGRVIGGSAIVSADVTNALGFAPMPNTSGAVISALGYTPISSTGTVTAASHFTTAQPVTFSGDATVSGLSISGTGTATGTISLSAVGTAGTYSSVVTDAKGRVVSGGPLTQSAVETALGFVPMPSSGTAAAATILASGQNITYVGDVSGNANFNGSVAVNSTLTLASVGTSGTYTKVTTDAKGRVVGGGPLSSSDVTAALGYTPAPAGTGTVAMAGQFSTPQPVNLTGDASVSFSVTGGGTPATGSVTLASVGSAGSYNTVTVDAKGRVIAGTNYVALSQAGANTNITAAQILSRTYHVDNYGAVGNSTQYVSSYSIAFASNILTSSTPVFNSLMVGQTVLIPGAGQNVTWPANGSFLGATVPGYLVATITAYNSSTQVTLSAVADVALVNSYFPLTVGNDDSAAFNVALTALGAAGGGRLQISAQKRYLLATQQVSVPANTGIWCENKTVFGSSGYNNLGGALIVPPGAPVSTANSGSAGNGTGGSPPLSWNPERTTNAITLATGAWVEGLYVFSPSLWSTNTALDQEAMVNGTQYGFVVSGNGIQMDGLSNIVKNCMVVGFGRGIVHVEKKLVASTGAYYSTSGGFPKIEDCKVVCATGIEMGTTGSTAQINKCDFSNYVSPNNIGASPSNWNFASVAPVSDGASGCILSLSGTGVILGSAGTQAAWISGTNPYIGNPLANNTSTLTVTLYDVNGNPVTGPGFIVNPESEQAANRITGTLISNGSGGYDLHLPNTPPTSFQSYGPFIAENTAQIGATGVSAVPAQGSFTFTSTMPGAAIYGNNAAFLHIRSPKISAGNGILLNSVGVATISDIDGDGEQDACTPTFGFAVCAINGCTNVSVIGGAVNNFYGTFFNDSTVNHGGDAFTLSNLSSNGPLVHIFQNGTNVSWSGGFVGHAGAILTGQQSQGLSICGGLIWANSENNNPTYTATVYQTLTAPPIYVSADCIGAPLNLVPNANYRVNAIGLGADPTGVYDNTVIFQEALNAMSANGGGTLVGNPTDFYLIESNLTIPQNCSIDLGVTTAGVSTNGVFGPNITSVSGLGKGPGGCILLSPFATIFISDNAGLVNGYIVNSNLPVPNSNTTLAAGIAGFSGTAITVLGGFVDLANLMIVGFNLAISATAHPGKLRIDKVFEDCTNGLLLTTSTDVDMINRFMHNAWYVTNIQNSWAAPHPLEYAIRQGYFVSVSNGGNAPQFTNCFSWGHTVGFQIGGTSQYLTQLIGCGVECGYTGWGPSGLNLPASSVIGVQITGSADVRITDMEVSNFGTCLQNSSTQTVSWVGGIMAASGGVTYFADLGAGSYTTIIGAHFNAGPTPCNRLTGVASAQFIGCVYSTVENPYLVDDASLPNFTNLSWSSNSTTNDPYAGLMASTGIVYKQGGGGTIVNIQPSLLSTSAPVYSGGINFGTLANPFSNFFGASANMSGNVYGQSVAISSPTGNFAAAGTNQATATQMTVAFARVNQTPSGSGVMLPSFFGTSGHAVMMGVVNAGSSLFPLQVYPPVGSNFTGLAANAPVQVPTAGALLVMQISATEYTNLFTTATSGGQSVAGWTGVTAIAGAHTIHSYDVGSFLNINSSGSPVMTLDTPANLFALPGDEIGFTQTGTGAASFSGINGVSLVSMSGLYHTGGQYTACKLTCLDSNTWLLSGTLA